MTRKKIACLLFLVMILMAYACGRHKVVIDKGLPSQEKIVDERRIEEKKSEEKRIETKGVYHEVERYQTLYRICKTYGADIHEVASLNGITDPNKIQTGQRLFIPGANKVLKVEIVIDDVVTAFPDQGKEKVVYKRLDFIWPVEGQCIDYFNETEKRRHHGIDIASSLGVSIKASESGTVIYSSNTISGYGNLIILRHSEEFVTVYAHNQVNLVEEGSWVEKRQVIGRVGQTGRTTGPHLHFEIRKNNKAVDPLLFLK